MQVTWRLDIGTNRVTLELSDLSDGDLVGIVTGLKSLGSHAHGTFYAETEAQVIGVTDDADGCVATRDGEAPGAILYLYHCK